MILVATFWSSSCFENGCVVMSHALTEPLIPTLLLYHHSRSLFLASLCTSFRFVALLGYLGLLLDGTLGHAQGPIFKVIGAIKCKCRRSLTLCSLKLHFLGALSLPHPHSPVLPGGVEVTGRARIILLVLCSVIPGPRKGSLPFTRCE